MKPGKGSSAVVMNRKDFMYKVHQILKDTSRLQADKPRKVITSAIETKASKHEKGLLKRKLNNSSTYNNLKVNESRPLFVYGLPKVYKSNVFF